MAAESLISATCRSKTQQGKKAMLETPTASDVEKAHLIVSEFGLLIGPAGEMSDLIARAVAAGIALGRKEALAKKRERIKT
jgi:hypothetical protein